MGILNSIQGRPDNQKKIFSLVTALILTFVIVVVWFSFGENKTDSDLAEDVPAKLSSLSPIQVIKDEFSKAFANFKATVPDLSTTTIDSTSTVSIPVEIIEEATSTSSGQATSSTNE